MSTQANLMQSCFIFSSFPIILNRLQTIVTDQNPVSFGNVDVKLAVFFLFFFLGFWKCKSLNIFCMFSINNQTAEEEIRKTKEKMFYSSSKFCCKRKLAARFSFFSQAKKACITSPSGNPSSFSCN